MSGHDRVPPRRIVTLEDFGAKGRALWVERFPGGLLQPPSEPFIPTFSAIALMTQGKGRARQLTEQVSVSAGDIHVLPAGVEHHAVDVGNMGGWMVVFEPGLLRSLGLSPVAEDSATKDRSPADPVRSFIARGLLRFRPSEPRRQHIERLIREMDAELRESRWGAEGVVRALFTVLVTELGRELQELAPGVAPKLGGLVRDALTFIETHCLESISLQDVAAAVNRTPSHVATAIRQETGLTVGDWLREHRMSLARQRLLETSLSVAEIASQVGYADVTHFIRHFRRLHGMTPRAWREHQRQRDA